MDRNWWTRLVLVVTVALGCLWFLVPTYYSFFRLARADRNNVKKLAAILPAWAPSARFRLSVTLTTNPESREVTLTAKDPGTMDAIEKDVLATFEDFTKVKRDGASLTLQLVDTQISHF